MRMGDKEKLESAMKRALKLVTEAMDLLDAHGGPPDASANLAMAQAQLHQAIAQARP